MTTTTHTCEAGISFTDFDGASAWIDCNELATKKITCMIARPLCAEHEGEQLVYMCAKHAADAARDDFSTILHVETLEQQS